MKMEELDRVISQAGRAVSRFVNYPAYVADRRKEQHHRPAALSCCRWMSRAASWCMMMGDNRVKSQLLRMQLKVEPGPDARLGEASEPAASPAISVKEMNLRLMAISDRALPRNCSCC